jgi:hypothetical protein
MSRIVGALGRTANMQKFAHFSLGILLVFALVAAVEGSVQTEPIKPQPLGSPLDSPVDGKLVAAGSATSEGTFTFCSAGIPRLMIDTCVGCVKLGPRGPISLCDFAEAAGLQRQTLPEAAAIAVWSLIGLCWSGVSCWRRRRGPFQSRVGCERLRAQSFRSRPPWPDHVRARIIEIIEKGVPQ